jgi:DNA invertase Pin-like site-specific DNA recombinase
MPEVLENGRHTKMTLELANEIRNIYQTEKISYQKLADKYGVSKSTIADIISNRTWKNV